MLHPFDQNEGNIQRLFGTDASDDLQEEGERYHLAGEDDPVWNNAIAGVRFTMQVREARRTTNDRAAAVVHLNTVIWSVKRTAAGLRTQWSFLRPVLRGWSNAA